MESKVFIFSEQIRVGQYLQANQYMKVVMLFGHDICSDCEGEGGGVWLWASNHHDVEKIFRMRRHLNC